MKALHILSQIEMTGAEAYAVTLSEWLLTHNCEVIIVSDKLHMPTKAHYISRQIHKPNPWMHLKNILFLRKYIRTHQIQIVHCHSRAAIRAGFWATRGLPVALISTIHGRQHPSLSKRIFDLYGDRIIGVCNNILKNLQQVFKMNPRKMICIGNPVQIGTDEIASDVDSRNRIAIISRSSGPKGQRTRDLIHQSFSKMLANNPNIQIDIIGGPIEGLDSETNAKIYALNKEYGQRVHLLGYMSNLSQQLQFYKLIIGSGRVPIETISRGILSYAIGEYSCEGLITPENYLKVKESNFGDIGVHALDSVFDYERITLELNGILKKSPLSFDDRQKLKENVRADFALENTCAEIFAIYRSTYFRKIQPRHIPVLMYHKVPDQEITAQHRIFVTKNNFEKHLQYFKKNKFTTLSFHELDDYRQLRKDPKTFPKKPLIITFDDGYVDNLRNAGPLLQQYGMKATIFLLADSDVRSNYWDDESGDPEHAIMALQEKKELLKYPFEIGSHGFKHDKITSMTVTQAYHELTESKKILEQQLNTSINTFAFTYGITTPWAARLAQKAGYAFAVNTDTGGLHIEEDPYAIFRTPIFPEDGPSQLRKKTSTWYRKYFFIKRRK